MDVHSVGFLENWGFGDFQFLKSNPNEPEQPIETSQLAPLVATPQTFDGILRANNPAFAYADHDAQGYAVATVTQAAFTVVFNKVKPLNADGSKPASPLAKRTRITLAVGSTAPKVEDNIA